MWGFFSKKTQQLCGSVNAPPFYQLTSFVCCLQENSVCVCPCVGCKAMTPPVVCDESVMCSPAPRADVCLFVCLELSEPKATVCVADLEALFVCTRASPVTHCCARRCRVSRSVGRLTGRSRSHGSREGGWGREGGGGRDSRAPPCTAVPSRPSALGRARVLHRPVATGQGLGLNCSQDDMGDGSGGSG